MPFTVKVRGVSHEAREYIEPEEAWETEERLSHAGLICFESYIMMSEARREAIRLWHELQALHEEMDRRGLDHPKYIEALNYAMQLDDQIVVEQVLFLQSEQHADVRWKSLSKAQRASEQLHSMFGVRAERNHLYGLWRICGPGVEEPDPAFHMHQTALLIARPEQKTVYLAERFGRNNDS